MRRINSIFTQEIRNKQNRYFSESLKKEIVRGLERNLHSVADVCQVHQVSRTSVYRWIYKYSSMASKQVKQVVEAKSDTQKIKALEERIKELERVIGQKQLLLEFKDKMIEIAESTYHVDIKKKLGSKALSGTTSTEQSIVKS
jgi:transposase